MTAIDPFGVTKLALTHEVFFAIVGSYPILYRIHSVSTLFSYPKEQSGG